MKLFESEIDRLDRLRDLISQRQTIGSPYNMDLARDLARKIHKVTKHFQMINEAYDQDAHLKSDRYTPAFIGEIKEGCQEIEDIFLKLKV